VLGLGHTEVATYIQSGNVVFTSEEADTATIAAALERVIAEHLGVQPKVIVLTLGELCRWRLGPAGTKLSPQAFGTVLAGSDDLRAARAAMWARRFDTHDLVVVAAPAGLYRNLYTAMYGVLAWQPLASLPEQTDPDGRHLDYADVLEGRAVGDRYDAPRDRRKWPACCSRTPQSATSTGGTSSQPATSSACPAPAATWADGARPRGRWQAARRAAITSSSQALGTNSRQYNGQEACSVTALTDTRAGSGRSCLGSRSTGVARPPSARRPRGNRCRPPPTRSG
jgi:hypothetical protein